jgi:hypothetical protein
MKGDGRTLTQHEIEDASGDIDGAADDGLEYREDRLEEGDYGVEDGGDEVAEGFEYSCHVCFGILEFDRKTCCEM